MYAQIIGMIINSAVGAFVKSVYDSYFNKANMENFGGDILDIFSNLSEQLDHVTKLEGCTRALMLKCNNGDKPPGVGSDSVSSVVLESRNKETSVRHIWKGRQLDMVYLLNLDKLKKADKKTRDFSTEEFKNSDVYDIYMHDGVKFSRLAVLPSTKKKWLYLSFNFSIPKDQITAKHNMVMDAAIQEMRNILKHEGENI